MTEILFKGRLLASHPSVHLSNPTNDVGFDVNSWGGLIGRWCWVTFSAGLYKQIWTIQIVEDRPSVLEVLTEDTGVIRGFPIDGDQ